MNSEIQQIADQLTAHYGWFIYIGWGRDDLDHVVYKSHDRKWLWIDKASGQWTLREWNKACSSMIIDAGSIEELETFFVAYEAA